MTLGVAAIQPQAGMVLAERFCLKHRLGRGAMGCVWMARDEKLDREVAIKFLDTDLAASHGAIERFGREALAVSRIASIHVVKVLDYGVVGERLPYIVLERLRGFDLEELLERDHVLSVETTLDVVKQTCRALAAAHHAGIIHRDIKPSNIFLTADGNELFVHVFDFGVAKLTGEQRAAHRQLTMPNTVIGTLEYMSPEQAMGMADEVDARADLYALGVVAYRCMTGRPPYLADSLGELLATIAKGRLPSPSEVRHEIPPDVDEFVRTAIAIDRDQRFSSAEEMGRAVVRLQKSLLARAGAGPAPERGANAVLSVPAGGAKTAVEALQAVVETREAGAEPGSAAPQRGAPKVALPVPPVTAAAPAPKETFRAAILKTIERHSEPVRQIADRARSEAGSIAPQVLRGRRSGLGERVAQGLERGVYWCNFAWRHHREAVLLGAALLGATILLVALMLLL